MADRATSGPAVRFHKLRMARKRLKGKELAEAFEQRTGQSFRDISLLDRALTHASAREVAGFDYQRLEFLGDRVLGIVIAEMLFKTFPEAPEGELSVRLNALVNAETLADIADEIDLADLIQAGSELRSVTGRKRINLRADIMEALIAAIYLEGGLEAARKFIHRYWTPRSQAEGAARRDPKTELQEWAHQVAGAAPTYSMDAREGPDHDPLFTISVHVKGYAAAKGRGRSKREAEQAAATAMLLREGIWQEAEKVS